MKELVNSFLEKYVYYKPVQIEDYDVHNEQVLTNPKLRIETASETIFDPNYGFTGQRAQRVARATPAEVFSAKLPDRNKDYCADYMIRYKACRRDNLVSVFGCHHYKEELADCYVKDAVLNQKEWEREKRLILRNKRIKRMEIGLES